MDHSETATVAGISKACRFLVNFGEDQTQWPWGVQIDQFANLGQIEFLFASLSPSLPHAKQERVVRGFHSSTPGTISEPESPHIWLQLSLVCFEICTDDHPGCESRDGSAFFIHG